MRKTGGTEKKRVRRQSTAVQNAAIDPNSDAPPRDSTFVYFILAVVVITQYMFLNLQKQAARKDLFQLFAEKVRDHKDLESRWAVLQETRVEYFRGKDFVGFLRNHPEVKDILDSDKNLETEDIGNALLSKNLLVRCDRVVKTVRPGKRKLSTWPAHLEIFPDQVFSEHDAFFAWTFVKRRPFWQTLLSFCWPVLTLAICLFPVYPHQCKLLILYSCAGVLLLILSLLLLRAAVFGLSYILLGKRMWFFPNILAEEATLRELFRFWPSKDEEEKPKWTTRLFYAMVAVLIILLMRHHAPDEAARARLALSGMMEKQQTVVNATKSNPDTAENQTDDVTDPDSIPDQPEPEIIDK
ncbi:sec62 [Cucurbita argyrosperma subsp. argyrosperma]|nr:sec62 [Cucurbita argyrosperma subsp. argyrosperma]